MQEWAARPAPKPAEDEMYPDRLPAVRLAAEDLTLDEFTGLCKWHAGHAGLYPAMQAAAAVEGREGWDKVFAQYCPTVEQRQAAFAKFAKLVQAVLDADPATLPTVDIGLAPPWLAGQSNPCAAVFHQLGESPPGSCCRYGIHRPRAAVREGPQ